MSLIQSTLVPDFVNALALDIERFEHQNALTLIQSPEVVVVGGLFDEDLPDYTLRENELTRLFVFNRVLMRQGFTMSANPEVMVSNLDHDSDFLDGNISCKLAMLSCLFYKPDEQDTVGASRQSPLAFDPKNWDNAFKNMGAIALFNMWFSGGDPDSGARISELINTTGAYDLVERAHAIEDDIPSSFVAYNKFVGSELFLSKDIS